MNILSYEVSTERGQGQGTPTRTRPPSGRAHYPAPERVRLDPSDRKAVQVKQTRGVRYRILLRMGYSRRFEVFGSAAFAENLSPGPYRTPGPAVLSSILFGNSRVCMFLSRSRAW